ncbi:MAG: 30S ribosomal protein S20 [Chloroflexi bacterium]|nr:30S ribosomal protein S20 [Chloroflexota bacterium]
MANIKSQIKRNRQNDKKRLRNRVYRGEARISVKNARTTIEEGAPESKAALLQAISALDKAAEQGVIHRNNAARRKSRLVKAFAKMVPVQVEVEPAALEPVLEAEPVKKKAAPRRAFARKVAEPKAEATAEPKAKPKKTTAKKPVTKSSPKKKTAAKKAETKKPETTSSPKGKKTITTRKKPTAKE